jgi:hypothetical protein
MSMYLPAIVGAMLVCAALSHALPAWRRPLIVLAMLLMAASVFAPDIALGVRLLAAGFAALVAVMGIHQLRRS